MHPFQTEALARMRLDDRRRQAAARRTDQRAGLPWAQLGGVVQHAGDRLQRIVPRWRHAEPAGCQAPC